MPPTPTLGLRAALRSHTRALAARILAAHPAHGAAAVRTEAARLQDRTASLRARLDRLDRAQGQAHARARACTTPFQASDTMDAVHQRHPQAQAVLARHHLPACMQCSVRFDETLAEAADAYGLPLATLLAELNALLPPSLRAPASRRQAPREQSSG